MRIAKTVWKNGIWTGPGGAHLGGVNVFLGNARLFGGRNQASVVVFVVVVVECDGHY